MSTERRIRHYGDTDDQFESDLLSFIERYPRSAVIAARFPSSSDSHQAEFDPFGKVEYSSGLYVTYQLQGDAESVAAVSAYLQVVALRALHHEASQSDVAKRAFLDMARIQRDFMVAELARKLHATKEPPSC